MRIGCADRAAVQLDCALGDRKPKANAAARAFPRFADAVKRLKNVGKLTFRHARTVVADGEERVVESGGERNLDRGALGGVADGIAHYVFNAATQELFRAADAARVELNRLYFFVEWLGLVIRVVDHQLHQVFQSDSLRRNALCAALKPGEREQLPNELVHALSLHLNAIERAHTFSGSVLARQFQSDGKTRQRRTKLMRDIGQQAFL